MHRTCLNLLTLTIVDVFAGFGFNVLSFRSQDGRASKALRSGRSLIGDVCSNPTSDSFLSSILGPDMHDNGGPVF